jgi:hypothetical protein
MPTSRRREQPQRSAAFAGLSLDEVRTYRRGLMDEESRVSYWRRLVQARRQLLESLVDSGAEPKTVSRLEALSGALTETRPASGRLAYLNVEVPTGTPPLPDLERLWEADPAPTNPRAAAALAKELAAAEETLTAYRQTVHERLDETTAELVARYAEDPTSCFAALPEPPAAAVALHA